MFLLVLEGGENCVVLSQLVVFQTFMIKKILYYVEK